jgi:ParB/RepB/Spo0J family partition protein
MSNAVRTVEFSWLQRLQEAQAAFENAKEITIDPMRIDPLPGQPRTHFDDEGIDALAQSIALVGQTDAGTVRRSPTKPRRYELIDGERRLRAIQRLHENGHPEIRYRATLVEMPGNYSDDAAFMLACVKNFNRVGHTSLEVSDAIRRMHEDMRIPMEQVAQFLGITAVWAYQMHGLQRLVKGVRDMLDPRLPRDEQLPVTAAILISRMHPRLQLETAHKVVARTVPIKTLRNHILTTSHDAGLEVGIRKEKPSGAWRALTRAVQAAASNADHLAFLACSEQITAFASSKASDDPRSLHDLMTLIKKAEATSAQALKRLYGILRDAEPRS